MTDEKRYLAYRICGYIGFFWLLVFGQWAFSQDLKDQNIIINGDGCVWTGECKLSNGGSRLGEIAGGPFTETETWSGVDPVPPFIIKDVSNLRMEVYVEVLNNKAYKEFHDSRLCVTIPDDVDKPSIVDWDCVYKADIEKLKTVPEVAAIIHLLKDIHENKIIETQTENWKLNIPAQENKQ